MNTHETANNPIPVVTLNPGYIYGNGPAMSPDDQPSTVFMTEAALVPVRRRAWLAGWDDALNELHELGVSLSERERRALDRRRNELADLA